MSINLPSNLSSEAAHQVSDLLQFVAEGVYRDVQGLVKDFHQCVDCRESPEDTLDAIEVVEAWGRGEGSMPLPSIAERMAAALEHAYGGEEFLEEWLDEYTDQPIPLVGIREALSELYAFVGHEASSDSPATA